MSVLYVLIPVALLLATIAVLAFIRAVRTGQYDDLETPRWRLLTDEESPRTGRDEPASSDATPGDDGGDGDPSSRAPRR